MFWLPVVLLKSALTPLAVLALPVVLLKSVWNPVAVLLTPVVLLTSAFVPRLVLVCAAATPARESEKMSTAITDGEKRSSVGRMAKHIKPSLYC